MLLKIFYLFTSIIFLFSPFSYSSADEIPYDDQTRPELLNTEPPSISISTDEKGLLSKGKTIFKSFHANNAQYAIAIFRVNSDPKTIWSVIKNFKAYPLWIERLKTTETYKTKNGLTYVKFIAKGLWSNETVWHAVHNYPETIERDWGTWQLDYSRESDLEDTVGFWRVLPINDNPHESNVIYSADIRLKGLIASLFESSLIDSSLREATQWVKEQSETNYQLERDELNPD